MALKGKRRRIFQAHSGRLPTQYPVLPSGRTLVIVAGIAVLLVAGWSLIRHLQAPASSKIAAPLQGHIAAQGNHLAVLDGETLRLGDQVVQLAGIVAPSRGSVCHGPDRTQLDCGSAATNALAALVRNRTVECDLHGRGANSHPIGDCSAGGRQLSQTLVLDGWARAGSADLRPAESNARAAGRGIWHAGS